MRDADAYRRKVIDGPLTVSDADGKELLRIVFQQGRRQGPVTVLDASGRFVLAAQFDRDVRDGYCVYCKDGAPWLVQEYADGTLGDQHLIKQGGAFHTVKAGQSLPTLNEVLCGIATGRNGTACSRRSKKASSAGPRKSTAFSGNPATTAPTSTHSTKRSATPRRPSKRCAG